MNENNPKNATHSDKSGDKTRTAINTSLIEGGKNKNCATKKAPRPQHPDGHKGEELGRGDTQLDFAKYLRSHQTEAEQRLWYHLRAYRFMNLKFKRQLLIGRYIADFVYLVSFDYRD